MDGICMNFMNLPGCVKLRDAAADSPMAPQKGFKYLSNSEERARGPPRHLRQPWEGPGGYQTPCSLLVKCNTVSGLTYRTTQMVLPAVHKQLSHTNSVCSYACISMHIYAWYMQAQLTPIFRRLQ